MFRINWSIPACEYFKAGCLTKTSCSDSRWQNKLFNCPVLCGSFRESGIQIINILWKRQSNANDICDFIVVKHIVDDIVVDAI